MFLKMTMMAEEEQQKMHEASLYVLENVGISIGSDDVRDMFEKEGAKVIGENVRFPKEMVEESLSHTVHEFTLGAYKEENRLQVPSTTHPYSTTAGYVPFVYDEETGEDRLATEADLTDVCRYADREPLMQVFWPIMMPSEYKGAFQEFKATEIALRNIGKHIQVSSSDKTCAQYQIEAAKAVAGGSEELKKNPVISILAAPTTPLAIEAGTADSIVEAAKAYVPMLPMSLPQLTTTSPATFAGNTLLVNCENLACHMVARYTNPDAPLYYSSDAGAPNLINSGIDYENFEYPMLRACDLDMARFYGMPSATGTSAEFKDFSTRAGFDRNVYRMALNLLSRVDVACWIGTRDSVLSSSIIDIALDLEVLRHTLAFFRQFEVNDDMLAISEIEEAGPRGNFLASMHTLLNFRQNIFTDNYDNCYLFNSEEGNYRKAAAAHVNEVLEGAGPLDFDDATVQALDEIATSAEKALS